MDASSDAEIHDRSSWSAVDYAWALQRAWSKTADAAKRTTDRAKTISLSLLVLAAAVAALASVLENTAAEVLGVSGAAVLGLGGAIQALYATPAKTREWTSARHASESLKSAVLVSLVGAPPYDGSDEERQEELFSTIADIEQRAATHVRRNVAPAAADLPEITDAESYCRLRSQEQRDWHARKSDIHKRRGNRLRQLVLVFTVTGAVLAAVAASFNTQWAPWIAAVASATAALTAHSNSSQDDNVAAGYTATANRLDFEIERFKAGHGDPAAALRLVRETERILAIQNENWAELIHDQ